jgi:hypothetical protein
VICNFIKFKQRYMNYSIVDGEIVFNEQNIKWFGRDPEEATLEGTADDEGNFTISVIFGDGTDSATYSGRLKLNGSGYGTAKSSWQEDFEFKVRKTGCLWLEEIEDEFEAEEKEMEYIQTENNNSGKYISSGIYE